MCGMVGPGVEEETAWLLRRLEISWGLPETSPMVGGAHHSHGAMGSGATLAEVSGVEWKSLSV